MDLHATADFAKTTGKINPWLHCSGLAPRLYPRAIHNDDDDIRALNLTATRTHDWALINNGQRIVDTHFIFPLPKLDPADPTNYFFKATDAALKLARDAGLEILYRLGTSIEHTGDAGHFNILVPEDFDKYAEVLAGIVRHYNAGWADGFRWNIQHWEIWNEPDGITNCWGGTGESGDELRRKFIALFVVALKRLKREFPKIKVGGPALCWDNPQYFTELLTACREAGVAPDFISWHHYGNNPEILLRSPAKMRALCDSLGFRKTKLVIDEWHYIMNWEGVHGNPAFASPDLAMHAQEGPVGHNNVDSAAFNLFTMSKWQNEGVLDQAYYYGAGYAGNWGYVDSFGRYNKCYHSLRMMGEFVSACDRIVASASPSAHLATLAAWEKDGKSAWLLVTEYRGVVNGLRVRVKGLGRKPRRVEALVLDHTRDIEAVDVRFEDGVLALPKIDTHSAAFLVKFVF